MFGLVRCLMCVAYSILLPQRAREVIISKRLFGKIKAFRMPAKAKILHRSLTIQLFYLPIRVPFH